MEKQGVSRADLARRLGTSPAYITKLLRGTYNPTLETVAKIAIALNARVVLSLAVQKRETEQSRESGRPIGAARQTPVCEVAAVSEPAAPDYTLPPQPVPTVADAPRWRPKRKRE